MASVNVIFTEKVGKSPKASLSPRWCTVFSSQKYDFPSASYMVCFVLFSLFNGISTLFRLFNAEAILLEEQ